LVQTTTADYLRDNLGWESIYAFDAEDFGPNSLLGRNSNREVVLTRYLRDKLEQFNPDLPVEAYDNAIQQLTESTTSQNLVRINQSKYAMHKEGVLVSFKDENGKRKKQRLSIFDFSNPENNHFLCIRELWLKGPFHLRRADIIGFVNGLPLIFMELKNITKNIRAAYEQNLSDYLDTIPDIFHHNAFVVLANGEDAKLGTATSKFEHFHEWKRLAEEEPGVVDMETLLKGVFNKKNFMDIFENFILFDDSLGEAVKILGRNHQYLGVNLAIESVKNRKKLDGKLGVFWHTQGSGKSYSMVFFTRKIRRKVGGNFTFLICTDRQDLDTQIYKTFAGCGLADNDKDPCRPKSGIDLKKMLGLHKAFIFTLVQKFNEKEIPEDGYSNRDDIIVITDEAHRTQYGTLSLNMRNALPHASYIGFTGTPLFKDDEITRRVFGDYVSTYDFQRAVDDKATLPIYYDARGEKLGLAIGDLNLRVAQKLEEIEFTDINVEVRLENELKREYHIITAKKRLNQIAEDFVQHFSNAWESGKAMVVCIDKITCVMLFNIIMRHWNKYIEKMEAKLSSISEEQEVQFQRRKIQWMRDTIMAVVISNEQGEVEKFRKWDLDIKPHRKIMINGFETENGERIDIESAFKKENHPFRVVFVCAMWLTGFDVPCLSTIYLDKSLKAHTLMQAIARANRVNEGKVNGLVVDYCGILKQLRKALATFAGVTGNGDNGGGPKPPMKPDEELLIELGKAITFVRQFLEERSASLDRIISTTGFARNGAIIAAKEAANESDQSRKRFEIMCREVFTKLKACINIKHRNRHRDEYDAINVVYRSLQRDREKADISDIIRQLHEIVDVAIDTLPERVSEEREPYDISKIDFDRLRKEFERSPRKNTTVQNLKEAIDKRLQKLLKQNPTRANLQQYYETVVAEYNKEKDRATIEKTFQELLKFIEELDKEDNRAIREGLDEESLAIYDLLLKPEIKRKEIKRIKKVSVGLLELLKKEKLKFDHWQEKESTRDSIRITINDYLWDDTTGLPVESYSEDDVSQLVDEVFQHVYIAYPYLPSPYYSDPSEPMETHNSTYLR